ncbi:MAG: hypothetical protein HYU41_20910 [Candidatus Rokubacteria bacterium]|nr:hypothetical protein [Candidatus Rokubacteria bacterium]
MTRNRVLPLAFLLAWIVLFGAFALGVSPSAFDDHPGQIHRVWLAVTHGLAPWTWHDGWWGGYPELQFYPPGLAYAGALLHLASLRMLSVDAAYHVLVWIGWAAPGLTVWLLLARLLGHGWAALPGAFIALTLSAGLASGVEGGVHIGMVPARLAWALLPLLVWTLLRASSGRAGLTAIPLLTAIAVTHPAHLPAAGAAVLFRAATRRALVAAMVTLVCAAALTGFWTIPLLVRVAETRALAWGGLADLLALLVRQPLAIVLVALAGVAVAMARTPDERFVTRLPWLAVAIVLIDAVALEPLGLRWLPADRLVDAAVILLVVAAGVAIGRGIDTAARRTPLPHAALAIAGIAAIVALSAPGETLTLWPRRTVWPTLAATERGLRLPELWTRLRDVPDGRVLFVRSGVPLVWGTEWWRPHTHATALTPRHAGRAIVNGTFTHPSPVAALVYRGDAAGGPIRQLVERLDGRSLFGRPLDTLDAATFSRYADGLGVSAVVALDEDLPSIAFVRDNGGYVRVAAPEPFVVYARRAPLALPRRVDAGRWTLIVDGEPGTWVTTRTTYYPLWRVHDGERALATRRGAYGDLEVRLDRRGATLDLRYGPGLAEIAGLAVTVVGLATWAGLIATRIRARG